MGGKLVEGKLVIEGMGGKLVVNGRLDELVGEVKTG
jgi:hypothetical protein